MKKWKVVSDVDVDKLEAELNSLEKGGWNIYSVVSEENDLAYTYVIVAWR